MTVREVTVTYHAKTFTMRSDREFTPEQIAAVKADCAHFGNGVDDAIARDILRSELGLIPGYAKGAIPSHAVNKDHPFLRTQK